ncbi:MAG: hypothetical protein HPY80_09995 [Bacteroidales bacterium]|nr:hypothetical protein [Bacteroidales bacterium]
MEPDLTEQARRALAEKNYDLALQLFTQVLSQSEGQTPLNYSKASFAAARKQEYKKAFSWASKAFEMSPEQPEVQTALAWALYLYIHHLGEKADPKFIITWITRIKTIENDGIKKPFGLAVIQSIPRLLKMESPPFLSMIQWLMQIDPEVLSDKPLVINPNGNNTLELASYREMLWAQRTQVLFEASRFEECIETCKQALEQPFQWHYRNDIWIYRRMALSHQALNNFNEALNIYRQVLISQPDWFIHYEYSKILYQSGESSLALHEAVKALLAEGAISSKIHLIHHTATILEAQNRKEEAREHKMLRNAIYREKGWRSCEHDEPGNIELTESSQTIYHRLRKMWNKILLENSPKFEGVIIKINEGGLSGFILTPDKKSYYFSKADWCSKSDVPAKGMKVFFRIAKRKHPKTHEPVDNAILVEPAEK